MNKTDNSTVQQLLKFKKKKIIIEIKLQNKITIPYKLKQFVQNKI